VWESGVDWAAGRIDERLARKAGPPAPVPQPVAKADLKAMSQQELQAEKEKIFEELLADPRFANISNFTPEEKAEWDEDHKHHLYCFIDIETEMEARAAQEQAVRA
jgi:hypothetical protein